MISDGWTSNSVTERRVHRRRGLPEEKAVTEFSESDYLAAWQKLDETARPQRPRPALG